MKKSDFLDELRLSIGMTYDYAENREDFIFRILNDFYEKTNGQAVLTVWKVLYNELHRIYELGTEQVHEEEREFGFGFFRGYGSQTAGYAKKDRDHILTLPVIEEGRCTHFITVNLFDVEYTFTKQDWIFINELIHFIQSKRSAF